MRPVTGKAMCNEGVMQFIKHREFLYMIRGTSVLVPPLGGKVVRSTKRGMLSGKGIMLESRKKRHAY